MFYFSCVMVAVIQARILEWVTISFSRVSSQSRDGTQVSHIAGRFFIVWATSTIFEIVYLNVRLLQIYWVHNLE